MTLQNADHWQLDYFNLICFRNPDLGVFRLPSGQGSMESDRMLKYTSPYAKEIFEGNIAKLADLPTLIVAECSVTNNEEVEPAVLARLSNVRKIDNDEVAFDYRHLAARLTSQEVFTKFFVPEPVSRGRVPENLRTHWAVKEGNLIEKLTEFWEQRRIGEKPRIFSLDEWPLAKRDHIAVMMPYSAEFDPVYESIKQACEQVRCATLRVDEIYGPNMVISDVFKTIETGKLVICDITGRNPNVLYEAGIAHARNVDVILLTQNDTDVPSNLGQIRYIKYLPNQEGLEKMKTDLVKSINAGLGNA